MKLGFGLYRHMLDTAHYDFALQCGATDLVVHLVDYFNHGEQAAADQPVGGLNGWGRAGDPDRIWEVADLLRLRREIEAAGLRWHAIENFDPAHWHDILLDGPKRGHQIGQVKQMIRNVGEAGIPVIGYNFSIAGVAGRVTGRTSRGNAECVIMEGLEEINTAPIRTGMVWNMWVDRPGPGFLPEISHEELWRRLERFLEEVVPVAEQAGVRLAAHPDDPPLDRVRGQPRLVNQPHLYDRLLAARPSPANAIEMCFGTIAEMTDGDVYETADKYSRGGNIAYVHLRNVAGKVPRYRETFIDEGDIDVPRLLRILRRNGFDGVIIPDHAPRMSCPAPWDAGMAFAMGYLKAAIQAAETSP
ncbi:MAG: mannonate dehydratase [Kiritimatiellia bacterium]